LTVFFDLLKVGKFSIYILIFRLWIGAALYLIDGQIHIFSLCNAFGWFCSNKSGVALFDAPLQLFGRGDFFLTFNMLYLPIALIIFTIYLKPKIKS